MDSNVLVNFLCQRCNQPIVLDEGFSHLNEHTLAELSLPVFAGRELNFDGAKLDKVVPQLNLFESSGQNNGFTLINELNYPREKIKPLKVVTRLFDHVSSNSNIDHPLCEECTDTLLDLMDKNLSMTQKQVTMYGDLVNNLNKMPDENTKHLEEELTTLTEEESRLLTELDEVEKQHAEAEKVLEKNKEEMVRLEEEEGNYWYEYCSFKGQLTALEEEYKSIKNENNYMQNQLDKLGQTNVFNSTFHIWYQGCYGTINNLRLGNLRTDPVEWPEINAAWGQTCLLLASLAKKTGFTFSDYRLVPYGNMSYIECLADKKQLPLYSQGGFRYIWDHKFDTAMVAFLECTCEFQRFLKTQESRNPRRAFILPYPVDRHFLLDPKNDEYFSIKVQFNHEVNWTKALKFLLTNLKWDLTWVASLYPGLDDSRKVELLDS